MQLKLKTIALCLLAVITMTGCLIAGGPEAEMKKVLVNKENNKSSICNPLSFIDSIGRFVRGIRKIDAEKARDDIREMFNNVKFAKFRELIALDIDGIRFKHIDKKELDKSVKDIKLSPEEKAIMKIIVEAINSADEHLVEYLRFGDTLSNMGSEYLIPFIINDYGKGAKGILKNFNNRVPAFIIADKGAMTIKTSKGSYSVLLDEGIRYGAKDYFDIVTNDSAQNPAGRISVTGHEVFGHGVLFAKNQIEDTTQHLQTIRFENSLLRMMGYNNIQRDGTNHGNKSQRGIKIKDPSKLPEY